MCVVTGASRGIGKGIALQLAEAGATVYITGRNMETLTETAHEVGGRGGSCVPVVCDSAEEQQVSDLFARVGREQQGRLDILVNNAYAGVQGILENQGKRFWEMPPSVWDDINNVGLRGHYLCSVHAARMMVKAGKGLIVIISSMGGLKYVFNVPYGVGKAACDRLAVDCAHELGPQGVAYVSLWPGPVRTETITAKIINAPSTSPAQQKVAEMFAKGETTEMSGRCIVALASDPDIMRKTGRVHLTCDLATEYGLSDVDGQPLVQYRSLSFLLSQVPGTSWISHFIPSFIRMPKWMFNFATNKF